MVKYCYGVCVCSICAVLMLMMYANLEKSFAIAPETFVWFCVIFRCFFSFLFYFFQFYVFFYFFLSFVLCSHCYRPFRIPLFQDIESVLTEIVNRQNHRYWLGVSRAHGIEQNTLKLNVFMWIVSISTILYA